MSGIGNAFFGNLCNCMWVPYRREQFEDRADFEAHGLLADDDDDHDVGTAAPLSEADIRNYLQSKKPGRANASKDKPRRNSINFNADGLSDPDDDVPALRKQDDDADSISAWIDGSEPAAAVLSEVNSAVGQAAKLGMKAAKGAAKMANNVTREMYGAKPSNTMGGISMGDMTGHQNNNFNLDDDDDVRFSIFSIHDSNFQMHTQNVQSPKANIYPKVEKYWPR